MLSIYNIFHFLFLATIAAGGQPYNQQSHICCNGTLHERPNTTEYQYYSVMCCNKDLLIYSNHIDFNVSNGPRCCDGHFYEDTKPHFECCGTELYNASLSTCIWSYPTPKIILIPLKFQKTDQFNLCGEGEFYSYSEQTCCSGVVHDRKDDLKCCKDRVYNTSESTCCGETVIPNENVGGKQCCGNALYNATEAMCCNDYVQRNIGKDKIVYETMLVPVAFEENQKNSEMISCCGNKLYDYKTQVCCSDHSILDERDPNAPNYGCCGTEILTDYFTQFCIDETIIQINPESEGVCGNKVFERAKHFCYLEALIPRAQNQSLCANNGLTYIEHQQVCGQHSIVDLTEDDMQNERFDYCEEFLPGN